MQLKICKGQCQTFRKRFELYEGKIHTKSIKKHVESLPESARTLGKRFKTFSKTLIDSRTFRIESKRFEGERFKTLR